MTAMKRLVVGVDGSDSSRVALEWACVQAGTGGTVTAVHAFPPSTELFAAMAQINLDGVRAQHQQHLNDEWATPPAGCEATITTQLIDDRPGRALRFVSQQHDQQPIVIGHHDRSVRDHVGHVATDLMHHADVAVIVTGPATNLGPSVAPVVVCVHAPTSADAEHIVFALEFAAAWSVPIHLVAVSEPLPIGPGRGYSREAYERDVEASYEVDVTAVAKLVVVLERAHPTVSFTSEVRRGHPVAALAEAVSRVEPSLVVVGNHHPSRLAAIVSGAITRHLPAAIDCTFAAVPTT